MPRQVHSAVFLVDRDSKPALNDPSPEQRQCKTPKRLNKKPDTLQRLCSLWYASGVNVVLLEISAVQFLRHKIFIKYLNI